MHSIQLIKYQEKGEKERTGIANEMSSNSVSGDLVVKGSHELQQISLNVLGYILDQREDREIRDY